MWAAHNDEPDRPPPPQDLTDDLPLQPGFIVRMMGMFFYLMNIDIDFRHEPESPDAYILELNWGGIVLRCRLIEVHMRTNRMAPWPARPRNSVDTITNILNGDAPLPLPVISREGPTIAQICRARIMQIATQWHTNLTRREQQLASRLGIYPFPAQLPPDNEHLDRSEESEEPTPHE